MAFGALLFAGTIVTRASGQSETRTLILVYDYVGIGNETLSRAEAEADQIFRQAGIEVGWRTCHSAARPSKVECPDIGPSTPALRLVSHFKIVPDHVRADTLGYSIGNMMTASWQQAEKVAGLGVAPLAQILGLVIAHEFGHLLLGNAHSISGVMQAHWSRRDWDLALQGSLVFLPSQAAGLRNVLRARSEALSLANAATCSHRLISERVWPELEMDYFAHSALACFAVERCASAPGRPDAFSLPSRIRVVDTAVHPFGEKSKRIGNAHDHEFSINQSK